MKLYRTGSWKVVNECQVSFGFLPTKSQILIRTASFLRKFTVSENSLSMLFANDALRQLHNIFIQFEWTNEWIFIYRHRHNTVKTVQSRTVSTGQKGSKSTYNFRKRYVSEETYCTKTKHLKNDTCIESRRDIKALTLLADATSSGNLFHSRTTRTEKKIWRTVTWNPDNTVSYCAL